MNYTNFMKAAAHVRPSARQLAWYDTEFYAFVHFTVNIILKEHVDVKVASMLQRTVEKGDIAKRKGVRVEGGLGVGA